MTRLRAPLLALLLAAGHALAAEAPPAPAPPAPAGSPPSRERPRFLELAGFGVDLGGSPGLFGARVGAGAPRGEDLPAGRWMAWLEADGTDWFQPSSPANAGRVDRILWFYPHLELAQLLVRRAPIFAWIEGGPTVGRYSAGGTDTIWFPGVALGAGFLWAPLRVGVTWYGQWKTATVPPAGPFASPDVRMQPMVLFTAGLELVTPFPR